jgi:hypothetical protein
MTDAEKRRQQEARRRDRYVKKYRSSLRREILRASEEYVKTIQFDGQKLLFQDTLGPNTIIEDVRGLWADVAPYFANRLIKRYKPKTKQFGELETIAWQTQRIQQYFYEHYEQISTIQFTTVETVQALAIAATSKAIDEGLGWAEVMKQLQKNPFLAGLKRSARFQAERIARTEVLSAQNFGSQIGAEDLNQTYGLEMMKAWLPRIDGRQRNSHGNMNPNQWIKIGDKFQVGDDRMNHPGDRSASAGNVINCRCACDYLPKDEIN